METTQSLSTDILFEPQPKQLQFIEAVFSGEYSVLVFGGSVGGGKSFVGIACLIMLARMYAGSKWVVIRESVPTLKRTSLETFKKLVPSNFVKSFNQQEQIVFFKNGSQLIFMGENYAEDKDFDRFKGLEVNGFLMEQIEELQEKLLDVCIMRAGRHRIKKMPPPLVLMNLNPTQTWAKKKVYEAYINGKLPKDWFYLPATIFDNPVLANDDGYMSRLKNLDKVTYRRLIEGDWSAFAVDKPFAYAFSEQKHVGKTLFNGDKEILLSFDWNVDPITCVAAQLYEDRIEFIQEFSLSNSNVYEICAVIKARFPFAVFLVTGDSTGRNRSALTRGNLNYYTIVQSELNLVDTQMQQPSVNPAVSDRRTLLNSILQNFKVIFDEENCPKTIRDMRYVEVDDFGEIKKNRTSDTTKSDLLDAASYLLCTFMSNFIQYNPHEQHKESTELYE